MTQQSDAPADDDQPRWFRRLDRWASVGWRFIIVIIAIGLALWLVSQLQLILIPAVFATFICTVLVPVRNFYERFRIPRTPAAALTVLTGFLAVGLVLLAIIPPIVTEWNEMAESIQNAYDEIFQWLEDGPFGLSQQQGTELRANLQSAQDNALNRLASGAVQGLPLVTQVGSGIILAVVVTFYFLRDGERIWGWTVNLLPEGEQPRVHHAGRRAWDTLTRYLRGMAIVAFIDAVGIGVGALIIGIPLAIPIGVLTFITAFVPIVGAVVAGVVATLIALANGGPIDAIWMLGVVVIVQQAESNLVAPFLVGRSVNIHPLVVLLGVAGGAAIAGILGAILVTPLVALVMVMVSEFLGSDHVDGAQEQQQVPGHEAFDSPSS